MKSLAIALLLINSMGSSLAYGQISNFQHIIVVVQENRSPDNLFQGLCSPPYGSSTSCGAPPTGSQYDIQTSNWLDKTSATGVTQPVAGPLANAYDLGHNHAGFMANCDLNQSGACIMDGAANNSCGGTCPARPALYYVDNSTGLIDPYLDLATQYGWANYMFQTNQGPSFPAHQFLFGGTSAPSASDDAAGTFAGENVIPGKATAGCIALKTTTVQLITTLGETGMRIYPCFEHQTLSDLLDSGSVSWRYYATGAVGITNAPNAINHICQPNKPFGGTCEGTDWVNDVVLKDSQILTDVSACKLAGVSWVIPTGGESDHPNSNKGLGPSWVASIVNAVGNNPKCSTGESYWNDTAILVTWDDWGGWYDHEPPTFLPAPQGDYQYGFRVPFLFVSAYTPTAYVDNNRHDFGSVLRFIEQNFGIEEGALNFADERATSDLTTFFNLTQPARVFATIPSPFDGNYFVNDKTPPTEPDDY